jgi:hypothetical protein
MNEIDYFKKIIICCDDVTADVDHLHVKELISEFLLYIYRGYFVPPLFSCRF